MSVLHGMTVCSLILVVYSIQSKFLVSRFHSVTVPHLNFSGFCLAHTVTRENSPSSYFRNDVGYIGCTQSSLQADDS